MSGVIKTTMIGWMVTCLAAGAALAQESTEDLKKEIQSLKDKVDDLDAKLSSRPSAPGTVPVSMGLADPRPLPELAPMPELAADDNPVGANAWLKMLKLTAFVDVGYTKNLNDPRTTLTNPVRFFDTTSNGFMFNMGELMLEKVASADSTAGIRLKLGFGKDAGVLAATENFGPATSQFDIVEGYVEYLAPIFNGVDFKVGKMATLAGYEVIESKDNWDYSRGLLFSWAIPLTHTGVRATYAFADQLSLTVGYVNGWNSAVDINNGKTFEGQLNGNPFPWLNVLVNAYWGAENLPGPAGVSDRYVVDLDATVTVKTWKFGINYDSGDDEHLAPASASNPKGSPDNWAGIALYVKDQLSWWYAPSIRIEQFRDSGSFAAFALDNGNAVPAGAAGKINMWEITLENEFKLNDNLLFRLEFRHDRADKRIFQEGNDTTGRHGQDTFAFEAIFMF